MTSRWWERIQDWVLLFVLLTTSMLILVAQNQPVVRSLRAASLEFTSAVESRFAWLGGYFRALDENSSLRAENIALSSQVARSRESIYQNQRLRRLIGFQDTTRYPLKAARVVRRDITRERNFLTLNVGSTDSVRAGMAVVDERGVLGRVFDVSPHYALVMPYLNTDLRIPGKIQSLQANGIVRWEGENRDELLMEYVSRTEPVLRGQLVVTSGASGTFPAGYPIGFVDSVATLHGRNQLRIFLTPTSPVDRADYVFVILNQTDEEQVALEQKAKQSASRD
ncbi:MAG TPA: rod shape-determining protein MreC [Rhodothermales bacterium]|nr:rod shape-determining protein MreC [Rhodothermales bacterium]